MSLAIFYFAYYALNMFRILMYPSSGACDCVDELPHRSSCSVKTGVLAISAPLRCVVVCLCDVFCRHKIHHTKHTTTHRKGALIAKTTVFTEQDDRCGNSSTQSQAPEDGYINVRNMLSA